MRTILRKLVSIYKSSFMNKFFLRLCLFVSFALLQLVHLQAQHWMTNREIYDFSVGDIYESVAGGEGEGDISRDSIMSKSYSSNYDTVFYKVYIIRIANGQGISDTVSYYDVLKYTHLDSLVMKGEHIDHRSRHDSTGLETYIDSMWIDSQTYRVVNQSYWQDGNHFEPGGRTDRYAEGLGEIFEADYDASGPGRGYQYLVYYRKGYEKWGKSYFDGIKEQESNRDQIKIYPVPARLEGLVTLANIPKGNVQLIIMDMSGRILTTRQYYSEGMVSCRLDEVNQPGIYLLKLVSGDQVYTSKLVISGLN